MAKTFQVSEADITEGTQGICLSCGEIQGGCEPDARGYPCESCGKKTVYGCEEALIMGRIELSEDDEDSDSDNF